METIAQSDGYLIQLQLFVEPRGKLSQFGFVTLPLTDEELLLKRRCLGCGKSMSQLKGRERTVPGQSTPAPAASSVTGRAPVNTAAAPRIASHGKSKDHLPTPQFKCKFHSGEVVHKYWTCCKQHCTADPCSGAFFHDPSDDPLAELAQHHQFHFTPIVRGRDELQDVRAAVALDCEMGTAQSGDSELIKITMIDYFTGDILLDNIVEPDVQLRHLNTRYSGVTWHDMRTAQRNRTSLKATTGAREALWRYVGDQTIVIGHGVSSDLRAMKWIHDNVVDSYVIEFGIKKRKDDQEKKEREEAEAEAKANGTYKEPVKEEGPPVPAQKQKRRKGGDLSLKSLTEKRLGRKIQLGDGTTGHDSLEDAIAARDLVHWHMTNNGTV